MPRPEEYEVLILGSGKSGRSLAWHLAGSGHRTGVVERRWIGGACTHVNCLPSKNEIWSAKVADLAHHAATFGVVTGPITIDMGRVRERKRAMVKDEIAAHLALYKARGAELIMGTGRFVAPKTLEVRLNDGGTRVLVGDRVFLNLGTDPAIPPIPGLGEVIAAVQTAMLGGLPYMLFRDAILTHPTMAEGLNALFATIPAAQHRARTRHRSEARSRMRRHG